MFNFQKIYLVLTVLFLLGKHVINNNGCGDKCGRLHIQFPFYLIDDNLSNTTGYPPEFGLLCNHKDETMLKLPHLPFILFVKSIDYNSQQIQIYDPQNCLPSVFLKLGNSSIYPFKFEPNRFKLYTNVSFLRCNSMSCPIVHPSFIGLFYSKFISCTKVDDVSSVQWCVDVVEAGCRINSIMKWSKLNCSDCEAQGRKCQWKNGAQGETDCIACPTNTIPRSTVILIAAGGVVGLMLVLLLLKALFHVYRYHKLKGEDQARIEKFLEDYRAMKPTRFTYADIKRITNGFSESLGEGTHGKVFKGMLSQEILVAVKILNDTVGDGKC